MEEIYQNLSVINLWGAFAFADSKSVEVTEIWRQNASGKVHVKHRVLSDLDVPSWLAQDTQGYGDESRSLVARYAWLDVDTKEKLIKVSETTKRRLLGNFGLELADGYARSYLSGATAFPATENRRTFAFCNVPKLVALWSHRRPGPSSIGSSTISEGVIFAQEKEKMRFKMCLSGAWDLELHSHPMFPALMCSLLLSAQIGETSGDITLELQKVEKRTGYHYFKNRHEPAAQEELGALSAKTSGYATKLASMVRKSKTVENLLGFISRMTDRDPLEKAEASEPRGTMLMKNHAEVLRERLAMQSLDTDYTLKRVQIQVDALRSIMTQMDSLYNLQLSQSTHEIAYFSYRDSSSMKTLAVVTMFFLPGSFISALFSTPCFEWAKVDLSSSAIGVPPTPQFRLYWAITIPLTLMTFILYFVWLWFQKRKRDRKFHDDKAGMVDEEEDEAEVARISRRRRQTILEKGRNKMRSFSLSM